MTFLTLLIGFEWHSPAFPRTTWASMERLILLEHTTPNDRLLDAWWASGGGRPVGVEGRGMDAYALGILYGCASYRLGGFLNGWRFSCGRFDLSRCCYQQSKHWFIDERCFRETKSKLLWRRLIRGCLTLNLVFYFSPQYFSNFEQEEQGKTYNIGTHWNRN